MNPNMGVFTTSSCLSLLLEKAVPTLNTQELAWLADGAETDVITQTRSISDLLMGLGALIHADGVVGPFQDAADVSNLLFSLSHQLSTINGLAHIAEDTNYLVRKALEGKQ